MKKKAVVATVVKPEGTVTIVCPRCTGSGVDYEGHVGQNFRAGVRCRRCKGSGGLGATIFVNRKPLANIESVSGVSDHGSLEYGEFLKTTLPILTLNDN